MTDQTEETVAAAGTRPSAAADWSRLFRELAGGRLAALDQLYDLAARELYGLALWRTGSREDAADVVQEVFLRVAERRHQLASVRQPRLWLLTVARRVAIDCIRRRLARRADPLEDAVLVAAGYDDADRRTEAARVSALLAGLPVKQREAVYLRHFADCSFAEMGRVLGVPTFTAASRYRLGIASLRRRLGVES